MSFLTFSPLQSMSMFGIQEWKPIDQWVFICIWLNQDFIRMFHSKYYRNCCFSELKYRYMSPLHFGTRKLVIIQDRPSPWRCDISPYNCTNNRSEPSKKFSKVWIKIVWNQIVPSQSYCSSGFRNVCLLGTPPPH